MADTRIQARVSEDVAAWLAERDERMFSGGTGLQAKVELGIWKDALAAELRRIRLTLNQANCLADILNGTMISAGVAGRVPVVLMEASDAFHLAREEPLAYDEVPYGTKWDIDEKKLTEYLRTLGPTADHALQDAVSRWWQTDAEATVEGWATVGLTVVPDPHTGDASSPGPEA